MSREGVLARIRAAQQVVAGPGTVIHGRPPAASIELPVLPAPQQFPDPVALFIDRARALGVGVEIAASAEDGAGRAAAWCRLRGVRRAAVWDTPDVAPFVEQVRAAGIDVLGPGAAVDALAAADVGITGAQWGIAETATVVLPTSSTQPRLSSLLPPLHLVVLERGRILPDLPALFASTGRLPSALTLVSGPSRSADVGLTPVLGAHGPMEVVVFLVGEYGTTAPLLP